VAYHAGPAAYQETAHVAIRQVLQGAKAPIKLWLDDVEGPALQQLHNLGALPFIHRHVAVMPDCHAGYGSTVGSVIPTKRAVIPAAVGVDIGCGMVAQRTTLTARDLPDTLSSVRTEIERAVPHGFVTVQGRSVRGSWEVTPQSICTRWRELEPGYDAVVAKYPKLAEKNPLKQLGTLGGGNHFIEICLDETERVWVMLHSGSRGIGNKIGTLFTNEARAYMRQHYIELPDADLAYLPEGTELFTDYWNAMQWAQRYAAENRTAMLASVLAVMHRMLPPFTLGDRAINCHHNYAEIENHFGENVYVTRKGAVRARVGDLGIIPGSMGKRSYIVEGLGNPESFHSCSHGAGRLMSRTKARASFTVADLEAQTQGVECRKDDGVLDEIPGAYKDIDQVMALQDDLVKPLHVLKQVLCVKG
jgi:tRNA-splicing ligase RtcB